MLRLILEVVPSGFEEQTRRLGEIRIINEAVGLDRLADEKGDYRVEALFDNHLDLTRLTRRIKGFDRSLGAWVLAKLALEELTK